MGILILGLILYLWKKKLCFKGKAIRHELIIEFTSKKFQIECLKPRNAIIPFKLFMPNPSPIISARKKDCIHEGGNEDMELPVFDFMTIANATCNFSSKNKLGEGGFGPVYKVNKNILTRLAIFFDEIPNLLIFRVHCKRGKW